MAFGKIYSYPNNTRVAKILIAAKYNGLDVEVVDTQLGTDNKTPEFVSKFPLGKVPAFEGADGFTLFESNAIAQYIASSGKTAQLLGTNSKDVALVQQWISLADNELTPASATWLFPILGWIPPNEQNTKKAKEDVKRVLEVLNTHLLKKTFLVGESVTLADITVATTLLNFYRMVFDPEFRAPYKNVNRWFITCINQTHFKDIIGEVQLSEKMQVAVAKKVEKKKEEKPKQEKPKEEKPKKEAKKKDDDEEEESYADEAPKGKNPLDTLPPSSFVLDNWKRFYSNNETRPNATNWFWENYDPTGYSLYKIDYKYNNELKQVFMSSNLIGGFFQRLESARKYAFGSLVVLGEDKNNSISGYFVFRGDGIPEEVKSAADYESYEFTKKDSTDPAVRAEYEAYIAWDETINGKKFADGKIFK